MKYENDELDNKIYSPKKDIVFKKLFGSEDSKNILKGFLNDMVGLDIKSENDISIMNTEVSPEELEKKGSRLDVRTRIGETEIDIEIQCESEKDFSDRTLYYWAEMYRGSLPAGTPYGNTRKAITLNLLDFNMFKCDEYCSKFMICETQRGEALTDKLEIHFVELPKARAAGIRLNEEDRKTKWIKLMNVTTREELSEMKENMTDTSYSSAVDKLDRINDEAYIRALKRADEEAAHERASREYTRQMELKEAKEAARAEGLAEGRAEGRAELEKASENAFIEGQQSMKERIYADLNSMSTEELLRFFSRDINDLSANNDQKRGGGRGR